MYRHELGSLRRSKRRGVATRAIFPCQACQGQCSGAPFRIKFGSEVKCFIADGMRAHLREAMMLQNLGYPQVQTFRPPSPSESSASSAAFPVESHVMRRTSDFVPDQLEDGSHSL